MTQARRDISTSADESSSSRYLSIKDIFPLDHTWGESNVLPSSKICTSAWGRWMDHPSTCFHYQWIKTSRSTTIATKYTKNSYLLQSEMFYLLPRWLSRNRCIRQTVFIYKTIKSIHFRSFNLFEFRRRIYRNLIMLGITRIFPRKFWRLETSEDTIAMQLSL